jgi:transmembrane sensor
MTQQQAESEALDWFLRHQAGQGAGDPAFAAWRDSDPAHAAAYARVQAVWGRPLLPRRWPRSQRLPDAGP